MRYLFDTSVYSQLLCPRPLLRVVEKWESCHHQEITTSAICEAELLKGLEWKQSPKLWSNYQRLLKGRYSVIPFDQTCAEVFAKIYADGRRTGQTREGMDLMVAATARAHGLIIATLNAKHFAGIEGVAVEDWSR